MATEFKLSYTASEINKKLGAIDNLAKTVNGVHPDENGNIEIVTQRIDYDKNDGRNYTVSTEIQGGILSVNADYGNQALTLDSVAYGGKTYREIFIDSAIIQNGDFENGIPSIGGVQGTYYTNAPEIQSDVYETGNHALMLDANGGGKYIILPSYQFVDGHSYYTAFRTKIDSYTQGQVGIQGTANKYAQTDVTLGAWTTSSRLAVRQGTQDYKSYIGCFTISSVSPILKAYIDNVCLLDITNIFGADAPDKGQMDVLYEQYIRILRGDVANKRTYAVTKTFGNDYTDEACLNAFMQAANSKASAIGMANSKFSTPSGLHLDNATNISTAADIMKLIIAVYGNDTLANVLSRKSHTFRTGGTTVREITTTSLIHANGGIPSKLAQAGFHYFGGKGGSLGGAASGQGDYGIVNYAVLCGAGNKQIAVSIMGQWLRDANGVSQVAAPLIVDALKKVIGSSDETPTLDAAISRTDYPVSVCACEVPKGNTSAWAMIDTSDLLAYNANYTSTPDALHVPASVNKLLTALMAVEYIDNLNELVAIHQSDNVGGSGQTLFDGETLTYFDLLNLTLLESNNNAATALARAVGYRILEQGLSATYVSVRKVEPNEDITDGSVDLTGYATEQWVQEGYQPKGNYLTAVPDEYVTMEEVEELLGIEEEFSVTGELVEFNLDVEPDTELEVISKIHRDETCGLSDKLVLHQVSGTNFVDLSSWLGGVGTVFEANGLTATVNADCTVTISGTNESTSSTSIINKNSFSGEEPSKVYPAGTYTIPSGFTMRVRKAQYSKNVVIDGVPENLINTVTIPEPFRIVMLKYVVKSGTTVDVTIPLGLFRGDSIPETGYEYRGQLHTVTFDAPVYEGEFNWTTGELKDADGNTVTYYESQPIKRLPGVNYFWTCFGENVVSNKSNNDLEKVVIRLGETAPAETVSSICDFTLTPTTPNAVYSLNSSKVTPGGSSEFYGQEIPLITTKGTVAVVDAQGKVALEKYVDSLINWQGATDLLTNRGIHKVWSEKFYFTKEPVSQEDFSYDSGVANALYTFEFTEDDFQNTGLPAKLDNIPIVSPCFYTASDATSKLNERVWGGGQFPATLSWDGTSGKYIFKVRGLYPGSIMAQLQMYTKAYLHYQLETPYDEPATFAMGISSGDTVTFTVDDSDWKTYLDGGLYNINSVSADAIPTGFVYIPRNAVDACAGMVNAARMLNDTGSAGGDATVQGYSWIGEGDGATDYTARIQSKLDELHTVSNGGTINLGPGTYPITKSLIVYNNTQIIGDGHTVIEQRADNTHAVIWNGSNIRMQDLTIKLAGACTEVTACIFANSNNTTNGVRDERYPENTYVQYCSTKNVTCVGTYGLSWSGNYQYLSEEALLYRGVGIASHHMYFNYHDCDGLTCRKLYAGIYGGGGSCNYRIYVTHSRFAVHGGGANNIYDIHGHTLYAYGSDGKRIYGTEYAYYGTYSDINKISIGFYDMQYSKGAIYFDGTCQRNQYSVVSADSGLSTSVAKEDLDGYRAITDYGRGNCDIQPYRERFVGVGPATWTIQQLPYWNTQFNPSIHNALSGAGVWGTITSNEEWTSNGIGLNDVCRYPKETLKTYFGLASTICNASPSEESPIEIIIDISDRPATNYRGFWIQFDHRYVAEEYTVSFDTTNDGVFDTTAATMYGNIDPVSYRLNYQKAATMVYRIKISITKALQIPEFKYEDAAYNDYTINYNPDGLIGIVNIGMPSNEAYGRAFLGECGGSLYGNVDMHQNTLKNLPDPVDSGDAVSKAYLEERISGASEFVLTDRTTGKKYSIYVDNGKLVMDEEVE